MESLPQMLQNATQTFFAGKDCRDSNAKEGNLCGRACTVITLGLGAAISAALIFTATSLFATVILFTIAAFMAGACITQICEACCSCDDDPGPRRGTDGPLYRPDYRAPPGYPGRVGQSEVPGQPRQGRHYTPEYGRRAGQSGVPGQPPYDPRQSQPRMATGARVRQQPPLSKTRVGQSGLPGQPPTSYGSEIPLPRTTTAPRPASPPAHPIPTRVGSSMPGLTRRAPPVATSTPTRVGQGSLPGMPGSLPSSVKPTRAGHKRAGSLSGLPGNPFAS